MGLAIPNWYLMKPKRGAANVCPGCATRWQWVRVIYPRRPHSVTDPHPVMAWEGPIIKSLYPNWRAIPLDLDLLADEPWPPVWVPVVGPSGFTPPLALIETVQRYWPAEKIQEMRRITL